MGPSNHIGKELNSSYSDFCHNILVQRWNQIVEPVCHLQTSENTLQFLSEIERTENHKHHLFVAIGRF